jgi:hypothetical protein
MAHSAPLPLLPAVLAACALAGCGSGEYQAPTSTEPHATLTFQRRYDSNAGQFLFEELDVLGQPAFDVTRNVLDISSLRADQMLIHPEIQRLDVVARFFHYEYQWVWNNGYYGGGYYAGGYSSNGSYVWTRITVIDGSCGGTTWLAAEEDQDYVLSFRMDVNRRCSIECYLNPGTGKPGAPHVPCPLPTAEEKSQLDPG